MGSRDDNLDLTKEIKIPLERCDEVGPKKKRVGAKAQSPPTSDFVNEDNTPVSKRILLERKSGSRDSGSVAKRGKVTPGQLVKTRTAAQRKIYSDSSEVGVETAITAPGTENPLKSDFKPNGLVREVVMKAEGPLPEVCMLNILEKRSFVHARQS